MKIGLTLATIKRIIIYLCVAECRNQKLTKERCCDVKLFYKFAINGE